ncbi:MAG: hypothetical protein ACI835_002131 [Planctomycetota bacterium]
MILSSLFLTLCLPAAQETETPRTASAIPLVEQKVDTSDEAVIGAITGGLAYLLEHQNDDGSWGSTKNATFTSGFANPATYKCWQVGTTALATLATMKLGKSPEAEAATDRGLDFLMANANLKRPADWDVDNVWGLTYGLDTLSKAIAHERFAGTEREAELRVAGQTMVDGLLHYASPRGGWGYYSSARALWQPEWATSFTTAVGLLALVEARAVGLDVPEKLFDAATRSVERCRLPNGAYSYSVNEVPPRMGLESINQVKGSLGRIQVCNLALHRAGGKLPEGALQDGLDLFFRYHPFLDAGRNKPIPHEAYYAVAAYFYLFGHYYAAAVIDTLPEELEKRYEQELRHHIMKCRQKDGAFWDFYIASMTKSYGTAFSIISLARTVEVRD